MAKQKTKPLTAKKKLDLEAEFGRLIRERTKGTKALEKIAQKLNAIDAILTAEENQGVKDA